MKWSAFIVFIYGLFILLGGVMGYVKSHSTASLLMGGVSAIIIFIGSLAIFKGIEWGYYLSFGITTFLVLFFGYRYYLSGKLYPPGIVSLVSILVLFVLFFSKWKR